MGEKNIFSLIENIIKEEIPKPIAYILTSTGFNTRIALQSLKPEHITQIEEHINENYENLKIGFMGTIYENVQPFKIIPGHCALIESLPQHASQIRTDKPDSMLNRSSNAYSDVLKLLIETAENNCDRSSTGHRFNERIQNFATYIYLRSGRSCYATLSANLPIPSANTIGNEL